MKILITGSAGFIGSALTLALLKENNSIVGIDNLNDYYDPKLKQDRLARHINHKNYIHFQVDIANEYAINEIFKDHAPEIVINLAGQPGVQHSLENPKSYINSNIVGFVNILEACKEHDVSHFIYASSSSVYGESSKLPFSVTSPTDSPNSLYAATKKSGEIIAHSYSHAFGLKTTGLRFFTVYGPWGRPDMAPFIFTEALLSNSEINLYGQGLNKRDFTYIDDVVSAILKIVNKKTHPDNCLPFSIFNIGNGAPITVSSFLSALEKEIGILAKKNKKQKRTGDVSQTFACMEEFEKQYGTLTKTPIKIGVNRFMDWYFKYHQIMNLKNAD